MGNNQNDIGSKVNLLSGESSSKSGQLETIFGKHQKPEDVYQTKYLVSRMSDSNSNFVRPTARSPETHVDFTRSNKHSLSSQQPVTKNLESEIKNSEVHEEKEVKHVLQYQMFTEKTPALLQNYHNVGTLETFSQNE